MGIHILKIDANKIIAETIAAFEHSGAAELYRKCEAKVEEAEYKSLHPQPLTPTNIKIDADEFNQVIAKWDSSFTQWGNNHTHLPRYGIGLVNEDGKINAQDRTVGSLMEWNARNPTHPLLETDCVTPTELMDLDVLKQLHVLDGYWCRSNILKWGKGGMFVPHIDTIVPSMWIRLWASMSPDVVVRFEKDGELVPAEYEVGRVYIIDTSIVHDAYANDSGYQLFLSTLPSSTTVLQTLLSQ